MDTLALTIVTPQRSLLETQAAWVDVPAESGAMRVLPHHATLVGLLGAGLVRYAAGGAEKVLAVRGGFVRVSANHVTLLADIADLPAQIDAAKARADWERLQRETSDPAADEDAARARLEERQLAEARVQAVSAAGG